MKPICNHVDPKNKKRLPELGSKSKQNETFSLGKSPMERKEKNMIHINESESYSPILCSELESARIFKRWITKEVLPSIRNTGRYSYDDMNNKYNDSLTFKTGNEDTCKKRIVSHNKGYLRGSSNLIINNITLDLQLSSRIQKELVFCHMISPNQSSDILQHSQNRSTGNRCCNSLKAMALRLSLVMTMTIN